MGVHSFAAACLLLALACGVDAFAPPPAAV